MKFKLKVKTGGEGPAPSGSIQPPSAAAQQQQDGLLGAPSQQWPPVAQPAPNPARPPQPAPSKPFKLKLKVAPTAIQAKVEPPQQPAAQQWEQPGAAAPPSLPPAAPPLGAPASGAGAPRAIKKIKLATGKPAGVPVGKKSVIKFKPPPKQPRDAAAAAAVDAGEPSRAAALPLVRLTLPAVGPVGGGGGGLKRPKAKGAKGKPGAKPGGGARRKRRLADDDDDFDDDFAPEGAPPARRPKRSRSELKELRDLGIDDLEDFDPDEPVAPRTFHLRSSHARGGDAAPSSTGLGLSAGGPAPSDARTGAGGGALVADTAGTEAPQARGEAFAAKLPPVPTGPLGPPRKEDFERLLARCQKKDLHSMFKEPVTEAIAPGYFSVIKRPMDFSTMRAKAQRGEYDSWEALRADMRLMFSNALTYNAEGGNVHNYAKLLMGQCDRIVELAMQGKTDFRSSATITRKHNAAVKAQQRAEREQLRQKARAEQKAAQEAKVLRKAGLESSFDEGDDENIRSSYRRPVRDANMARWRGLGAGCNADGVGWGNGREVLRPVNPWLPPGMYALSLARFAAGLSGRARELALRRARASTAADEAAERALQQELAKKVVLPPPPPLPQAPAPSAAPAPRPAATVGMPAGALPPAAMLAQQQLMMQAAAGRPAGMAGMLPGRPQGLPPGATITVMATPQGMVPFLIQPGQPPIMMMAPGMQPGMMPGGAGAKPGGLGLMPGMMPGLMPGMSQPGARPPRP